MNTALPSGARMFLPIPYLILVALLAGTGAGRDPSEDPPVPAVRLTADSVDSKTGFILRENWRYRPGDDPAWADPDLDDSGWRTGGSHFIPHDSVRYGWTGLGWLRLHLRVDSSLTGRPLGFHIVQAGASEVYLDGMLLYRIGRVGADERAEEAAWDQAYPRVIWFDGPEHVLAVRYSNFDAAVSRRMDLGTGFYIEVAPLSTLIEQRVTRERRARTLEVLFTAVPLAFSLLHLFLFLFYRKRRENLYFALLTLGIGVNNYFDLQVIFAANPGQRLTFVLLSGLSGLFALLCGLRLAYDLREVALPKRFRVLAAAGVVVWLLRAAFPGAVTLVSTTLFSLVVILEILRIIVLAGFQTGGIGKAVAAGLFLSILTIGIHFLVLLGWVPVFSSIPVYYYGVLCLLLTMSLYLSQRFAGAHRDLERRLEEVALLTERTLAQERKAQQVEFDRRLLEIDNLRKTRELDDARRLQLSMLPKEIPSLPHLELAVYTQTASEVGGDFYDFHVAEDGALTIAIGDATGHGTAAGLLVAAVKSLFTSMAETQDLKQILEECTRVIKHMDLGPVYMALQIVRFRGNRLSAVSAGMPYVMMYHGESQTVEEIILKGLPLGHTLNFPYGQAERTLHPGDTVMMMSDGFPELFNAEREMFDYDRVRRCFREAADRPPRSIVERLSGEASRWRKQLMPNDDITLVVVQAAAEEADSPGGVRAETTHTLA